MKLLKILFLAVTLAAGYGQALSPAVAPYPNGGGAVNAQGQLVPDPTVAVRELNAASIKRVDDLLEIRAKLFQSEIDHIKDLLALRAVHASELATAEKDRLNAIRAVDQTTAAKKAEDAQIAIQTLATTTATLGETLRAQVSATAASVEIRRVADMDGVNKRITELESTSSERKGKQLVSDPQVEQLRVLVDRLAATSSASAGKSEGISATTAFLITGGGLILAIGMAGWQMRRKNGQNGPSYYRPEERRPGGRT